MSIAKGDILSEVQYYTVKDISSKGLLLLNDNGQEIGVSNKYADALLESADAYSKVEKVTRTEMTEILLQNARRAMTVNYNKKVQEADIKKAIVALYPNKGGKLVSESDFKKAVGKALNLQGEERTMAGRHYGHQDANGRLTFIDMQIDKDDSKDYDTRSRLVDPRTLNWVIVGGTKYEVK